MRYQTVQQGRLDFKQPSRLVMVGQKVVIMVVVWDIASKFCHYCAVILYRACTLYVNTFSTLSQHRLSFFMSLPTPSLTAFYTPSRRHNFPTSTTSTSTNLHHHHHHHQHHNHHQPPSSPPPISLCSTTIDTCDTCVGAIVAEDLGKLV